MGLFTSLWSTQGRRDAKLTRTALNKFLPSFESPVLPTVVEKQNPILSLCSDVSPLSFYFGTSNHLPSPFSTLPYQLTPVLKPLNSFPSFHIQSWFLHHSESFYHGVDAGAQNPLRGGRRVAFEIAAFPFFWRFLRNRLLWHHVWWSALVNFPGPISSADSKPWDGHRDFESPFQRKLFFHIIQHCCSLSVIKFSTLSLSVSLSLPLYNTPLYRPTFNSQSVTQLFNYFRLCLPPSLSL